MLLKNLEGSPRKCPSPRGMLEFIDDATVHLGESSAHYLTRIREGAECVIFSGGFSVLRCGMLQF